MVFLTSVLGALYVSNHISGVLLKEHMNNGWVP